MAWAGTRWQSGDPSNEPRPGRRGLRRRVDNAREWGRRERLQRRRGSSAGGRRWWPGRPVRRLSGPALLVVGLVVGMVVGPSDGAAGHYNRACAHHVTQGYTAKVRYIRCEADRVRPPGSPEFAVGVARCESGVRARARNGVYAGVYQHHVGYWPGRMATFTGRDFPRDGDPRRSVWAFRTNVLVTLRMARASGWGAWSCA